VIGRRLRAGNSFRAVLAGGSSKSEAGRRALARAGAAASPYWNLPKDSPKHRNFCLETAVCRPRKCHKCDGTGRCSNCQACGMRRQEVEKSLCVCTFGASLLLSGRRLRRRDLPSTICRHQTGCLLPAAQSPAVRATACAGRCLFSRAAGPEDAGGSSHGVTSVDCGLGGGGRRSGEAVRRSRRWRPSAVTGSSQASPGSPIAALPLAPAFALLRPSSPYCDLN
jgi:hypothetical protein